jgi:hypothetical protein
MQALLDIAAAVQQGGKYVTIDQIEQTRSAGADDQGIYENIGARLAAQGYDER